MRAGKRIGVFLLALAVILTSVSLPTGNRVFAAGIDVLMNSKSITDISFGVRDIFKNSGEDANDIQVLYSGMAGFYINESNPSDSTKKIGFAEYNTAKTQFLNANSGSAADLALRSKLRPLLEKVHTFLINNIVLTDKDGTGKKELSNYFTIANMTSFVIDGSGIKLTGVNEGNVRLHRGRNYFLTINADRFYTDDQCTSKAGTESVFSIDSKPNTVNVLNGATYLKNEATVKAEAKDIKLKIQFKNLESNEIAITRESTKTTANVNEFLKFLPSYAVWFKDKNGEEVPLDLNPITDYFKFDTTTLAGYYGEIEILQKFWEKYPNIKQVVIRDGAFENSSLHKFPPDTFTVFTDVKTTDMTAAMQVFSDINSYKGDESKTVQVGEKTDFKNVHHKSAIKLKFDKKIRANADGIKFVDVAKITLNGRSEGKSVDDYFTVTGGDIAHSGSGTGEITLTPNDSFKPAPKDGASVYNLIIDTTKLETFESGVSSNLGVGNFQVDFSIEPEPYAVISQGLTPEGLPEIRIKFSRAVEDPISKDIKLGKADGFGNFDIASAKSLSDLKSDGAKVAYDETTQTVTISGLDIKVPSEDVKIFINKTTPLPTNPLIRKKYVGEPTGKDLLVLPYEEKITLQTTPLTVSRSLKLDTVDKKNAEIFRDKTAAEKPYMNVDPSTKFVMNYDSGKSYILNPTTGITIDKTLQKGIQLYKLVNNVTTGAAIAIDPKYYPVGATPYTGIAFETSGLELETLYKLVVDPSKFTVGGRVAGSSDKKEIYYFKTEPKFAGEITTKSVQQREEDSGIIVRLNLPAEYDKTKLTIKNNETGSLLPVKEIQEGGSTIDKGVKYYNYKIVIDKEDMKNAPLGKYTIDGFKNGFWVKGIADRAKNKLAVADNTFTVVIDASKFKANMTLDAFQIDPDTDELYTVNETSMPNLDILDTATAPKKIAKVYVDTDLDFELSKSVKLKPGKSINDLIKFNDTEKNLLITDYFNLGSDISGNFTNIKLINKSKTAPGKSLLVPGRAYQLTIDNTMLLDSNYTDVGIGNTKFFIELDIEPGPKAVQGEPSNKEYRINFDRKINMPTAKDIKLELKHPTYGYFRAYNDAGGNPILKDSDIIMEPNGRNIRIQNLPRGTYRVKINELDPANNIYNQSLLRKNTVHNPETPVYAQYYEKEFTIDLLSPTVSDFIEVIRFDGLKNVPTQLNVDQTKNEGINTEIDLSTKIYVKYTIPYTMVPDDPNAAFSLVSVNPNTTTGASIKFTNAKAVDKDGKPGIDGVELTLEHELAPDTLYNLIIHKSKFKNEQGDMAGYADENEVYVFTSESVPKLVSVDPKQIEQTATNQVIKLTFDKEVELTNPKGITIDGKTAFSSITPDGKTIVCSVDAALAPSLSLGKHTVNVTGDAIKRKASQKLFVPAFTSEIEVVEDRATAAKKKAEEEAKKKAEEEARKKKEEEEARKKAEQERLKKEHEDFRNEVSQRLAGEIQKRYQAEYGATYNFNGKDFTGLADLAKKLIDNGYVDDYMNKYGKRTDFIEDYMNRYGAFAYFDKAVDSNPFFTNPQSQGPHNKGYYDYYNYYDYGYRYPTVREGQDKVSQETLELKEQLKSKERELLAMQNQIGKQGFVNTSAYKNPVGIDSGKRIELRIGDGYANMFDEYGNKRVINLGASSFISNGRTMLPLSEIAQAMGVHVQYDSATKNTTVTKPGVTAVFNPNTSYVYVNGKPENMGLRPMISKGKLLIPVHYLGKALGLADGNDIAYNSAEKTLTIKNF